MPFVYIKDTAKVELNMHQAQTLQPIANVLHARMLDADQTSANLTAMASAVVTAVNAHLNVWSEATVMDNVTCTGLSTATAPQAVDNFSSGTKGSNTTTPAIPGVCALVKLTTAKRGRSYRGRIYIGEIGASAETGEFGQLGSTYITAVNDLVSAISGALGGLTPVSALVVASRKLGTSEDVTTFVCEPATAYQRRRALR